MLEKIKVVVNEDRCYFCGGCVGVCLIFVIEVYLIGWEFF